MPPTSDDLAVAAPLELGEAAVGLAPQLVADREQRMLGDVQAEALLLQLQQLGLLVLLGRDRGVVLQPAAARPAEVEDRALPERPVGLLRLPAPSACSSTSSIALARAGRARAALDERLERALVHELRVDALGEVPDRRERPALGARGDDRAAADSPTFLTAFRPKRILPSTTAKSTCDSFTSGGSTSIAELVAGVDVERHAVLRVHDRGDQRGHVLARVVRAQPGGAVGDERVAGGVRLVERVVLRLLHVRPELVGDAGGDPVRRAALEELLLQRGHQRVDLLADRLAQVVGLGGGEAGDLLRDLHVLLLVDADAVRGARDRLQPLVDVRDRLLAVLAARVARGCTPSGPAGRARRARSGPRTPSASPGAAPRACPRTRTGRRRSARRARASRRSSCRRAGSSSMSRPPPISSTALSITSRLRRPRKSIFSRPSASTSFIENWVTTSWSAPFCCSGTMSISGSAPITTPAAWIASWRVQPFERLREVDDLLRDRVGVDGGAQLLAGLEAVVERLARPFRDELRDLVDDAVRHLEHAAGVADGGAGGHRPEGDDLRDAVAAVLLARRS